MAEQKKRTTELDVDFTLTAESEPEAPPAITVVTTAEGEADSGLNPRKRLFLIIGSAVLSVVLAAVIYFVFIKKDASVAEEKKVEEAKPEEEIDAPKREVYIPPISYAVGSFFIPVGKGESSFLKVSVELILSSDYVIKDLDKNNMTLRQNLMHVFETKNAENFQDPGKKAVLAQEVMTAANRVLEKGTVFEVNFIEFNVQ